MMPLDRADLHVRRLPDGGLLAGMHRGLSGRLLSVEITNAADADFPDGCLVEVNWDRTTYLGQVYNRDGRTLVIGVEHAVERDSLSALQQAWRPVRF